VLLLGAGGGARAVALDALQDGAASLWVVNRHLPRAEGLLADLDSVRHDTEVQALALDDPRVEGLLGKASVVVNATSVGLASEDLPIDPRGINADALAVDLIYSPAETAFLRAARANGARVLGGLGMLVYQAAAAFERWTGVTAPVDVMRTAAETALAERASS
jgi:shikimate dehydrogenase